MSLSEHFLRSAFCSMFLIFAAMPAYGQNQSPGSLVCPATITIIESVVPIPEWNGHPARVRRSFERISIYNGTDAGQEFELAPDGQKEEGKTITQTWNLRGYRTMNIFLRCRYHDTSAFLSINLPPQMETCTFLFVAAKHGAVAGKSDMQC